MLPDLHKSRSIKTLLQVNELPVLRFPNRSQQKGLVEAKYHWKVRAFLTLLYKDSFLAILLSLRLSSSSRCYLNDHRPNVLFMKWGVMQSRYDDLEAWFKHRQMLEFTCKDVQSSGALVTMTRECVRALPSTSDRFKRRHYGIGTLPESIVKKAMTTPSKVLPLIAFKNRHLS